MRPGAVTPLAVVNDRPDAVTLVPDRAELLNVHPPACDQTTALAPRDLLRFVTQELGHPPQILGFDAS